MCNLLFYDFEVFKYDWLVCIGDVKNKKIHTIVNNKEELEIFFNEHKEDIWVGYNSRHYDQYILKSILCDIDPYYVSQQIIENDKKGYEISSMFNDIFFYQYDCKPGLFGLKKLEAFMGSNIKESEVSFDIDRKLTSDEINDVLEYCKHDVRETYNVFKHTISTFNSHIAMLKEFNLDKKLINKTPTQLTAILLGAKKQDRNDEFDISFPETLRLGQFEYIKDKFVDWSKIIQDYKKLSFKENIGNVEHVFGVGGLHGAIPNYVGEGKFIMADVGSYYPSLMIDYDFLSRNATKKWQYKAFKEDRMRLKKIDKERANIRKIPLNGAFGACKDKYNNLYDPRQSNNVCINGQLFLVDLLDKLIPISQIIQTNTDGILVKVETDEQERKVKEVCKEWSERTKFELDFDEFTNIVQRDVNNYIAWKNENGEIKNLKQKGAYKKKKPIDNELSIVLDAIINYFTKRIPVEETINSCDELIKFMMVANIGSSYKYMVHNGEILNEKIVRYFASKITSDTCIFKRKKGIVDPYKIDKLGNALHCFIDNSNIVGKKVPSHLDKNWYIIYTKYHISMIFGGEFEGVTTKQYKDMLSYDYEKGTGSDKPRSRNYNPNKSQDIMKNMIGKVLYLD